MEITAMIWLEPGHFLVPCLLSYSGLQMPSIVYWFAIISNLLVYDKNNFLKSNSVF